MNASYVQRLEQRAESWRGELPALRESAEAAARGVIAGGHLYFAGPQKSFIWEFCGRSGGLMLARPYEPGAKLGANDTIVAAIADDVNADAAAEMAAMVEHAAAASANVIVFGSTPEKWAATVPASHPSPSSRSGDPTTASSNPSVVSIGKVKWTWIFSYDLTPAESELSIDSVSNVIVGWTWVAEFVAACVRQGKMPCMYESYGMPGGIERGAALAGAPFHTVCDVTPRDADGLAARYLDHVIAAVRGLGRDEQPEGSAMSRAAALIRETHRAGGTVRVTHDGHMFPAEIAVPQSPAWFTIGKPDDPYAKNDVALDLSYQPYPWKLVKKAGDAGAAIIVTSAHVPPAAFATDPRHVYIDPHWQMGDASTDLPGYDAKILPISGIMQATIYWRLVECVTR